MKMYSSFQDVNIDELYVGEVLGALSYAPFTQWQNSLCHIMSGWTGKVIPKA